jgi:hypothetical protein
MNAARSEIDALAGELKDHRERGLWGGAPSRTSFR